MALGSRTAIAGDVSSAAAKPLGDEHAVSAPGDAARATRSIPCDGISATIRPAFEVRRDNASLTLETRVGRGGIESLKAMDKLFR
jgi:hypothetical protein